jgi:ABC-2 type transport system permease protein
MKSASMVSITTLFRAVPIWLWGLQLLSMAVFQMVFFVLFVQYSDNPEITVQSVALGNVVISIVFSTVIGLCAIPGMEKHTGTLPLLMSTPTRLFEIFIGFALFQILSGLMAVTISLTFAAAIFGVGLGSVNVVSLVLVILISSFSMVGFGMMLSSFGLFLRSANVMASLVLYLVLIISGANFPISYLPEPIQYVSWCIPVTYGIVALKESVAGQPLTDTLPELGMMMLIGAVMLVLAYLTFLRFERIARVTGSMDMF